MTEPLKGGCFCKRVRFEITGPILASNHCHCESCRRITSSPLTSWITVKRDDVTFSGEAQTFFHSSPGATRSFCPTCGSPLSYTHDERPGEIDLYAVSLDDSSGFRAQKHVFWSERVPWLSLHDDLPKTE